MSTITERLEAATQKAESASEKLRQVVHSDATTEIPTDSGPVPSLAKWYADLDAQQPGLLSLRSDLAAADGAEHVGFQQSGTGAVPRTLQDKAREVVSVKDFGAVGDGVADDTAAIQAAIDACAGRRLFFPAGTYKLLTGLVASTGIHLDMDPNAVLDYSAAPAGTALAQKYALKFSGALSGAHIAITANIAEGATAVQMADTAGLAAGDWVLIRSDDPYITGGDPLAATLGHMTRIKSVDSATQVTLRERCPFAYTAASNARVTKATMLEGVRVTGGNILCGGIGSVHNGFLFAYCDSPHISGVLVQGAEDCGINFANCVNQIASGNVIDDSTSPGGAIGNTGYGIVVTGGRGGKAVGNTMSNCRHAIAGGSYVGVVSIGFTASHNDAYGGGVALDFHEECYGWKYVGNTVIGCVGGAVLRGPGTMFDGNAIRDCGGNGVEVRQYKNNTVGLPRMSVCNNTIENTSLYGIAAIGHTVTTDKILGLILSGNQIKGTLEHGIILDYVVGAVIANCNISGIGGSSRTGMLIRNSERVAINGGQIEANMPSNSNGITIENSDRVTINGVHLIGSAGAVSQDGIRSSGTGSNDSIIINGCYIGGFSRYAVHTTNSDRVIVTSNDVRDVVGGVKIAITGATTSINANNIT